MSSVESHNDDSMETVLVVHEVSSHQSEELEVKEAEIKKLKRSNEVLKKTNNGLKEQIKLIMDQYEKKHSALEKEDRTRIGETAIIRKQLKDEETRLSVLIKEAKFNDEARHEKVVQLKVENGNLKLKIAELEKKLALLNSKHSRLTAFEYTNSGYKLFFCGQVLQKMQEQLNQVLASINSQPGVPGAPATQDSSVSASSSSSSAMDQT
jgi:chromosome segregation ATPase